MVCVPMHVSENSPSPNPGIYTSTKIGKYCTRRVETKPPPTNYYLPLSLPT